MFYVIDSILNIFHRTLNSIIRFKHSKYSKVVDLHDVLTIVSHDLENCFIKFINKTPPIGKCIICIDDKNIKKLKPKIKTKNILTYGFSPISDYQIIRPKYNIQSCKFDLVVKKR